VAKEKVFGPKKLLRWPGSGVSLNLPEGVRYEATQGMPPLQWACPNRVPQVPPGGGAFLGRSLFPQGAGLEVGGVSKMVGYQLGLKNRSGGRPHNQGFPGPGGFLGGSKPPQREIPSPTERTTQSPELPSGEKEVLMRTPFL